MKARETLAPRQDAALVVLRIATGVSLLVLFGWQKVHDARVFMHTGQWTFVDFNRHLRLPLPVPIAYFETLNESLGAILVTLGLLTRYAATLLMVGFAAATTCSLIADEPAWRFAALYFLLAAAVWLGGPGKYSADHLWAVRRSRTHFERGVQP